MIDDITQEMVRTRFLYNKEHGRLIWLTRPESDFGDRNKWAVWNSRYAGEFAGSIGSKGYIVINVFGKMRKSTRLIWMYHFGVWPDVIDHIDGDKTNDRLINLRDATIQENCRNRAISTKNRTGHMGVYVDGGKFRSQIRVHDKTVYLGTFGELVDAVKARKEAEYRYGYHANHGRRPSDAVKASMIAGIAPEIREM